MNAFRKKAESPLLIAGMTMRSAGLPFSMLCVFATVTPALAQDGAPRPATTFAKATCRTIAEESARRLLPSSFFARLIWRESLFNPAAVSHRGAQGIAQFMPATAKERGLADPFDAPSSLIASAGYLRSLHDRFGSIGLAAAAYNAGPNRVDAWMSGRATLPLETREYVLWITGHPPETWRDTKKELALLPIADGMPFSTACEKLAARGLTAKLPDKTLRPAVWQKMFAAGLGIVQVKASKPGRIRVVIETGQSGSSKPSARAR